MARSLLGLVGMLLAMSVLLTVLMLYWTHPHISSGLSSIQEVRYAETGPVRATPAVVKESGSPFTSFRQLWWFAPVWSGGGYSSEAVDFLLGLHKHAWRPQLHGRLIAVQHGDMFDEDVLHGMRQNDSAVLTMLMAPAPALFRKAVVICHSEPGAWALPEPLYETSICPPPGSLFTVGRTMFETDRLSPEHARRLNGMHQTWVPTHFHKEVFAASGVQESKLVVMPEPVDVDFFSPSRVKPLRLPLGRSMFGHPHPRSPKPFVFLSLFKWEARKAWDVLLASFLAEFTARDHVELYMLTHPFHGEADFERQAQAWAQGQGLHAGVKGWPTVQVITEHIPQENLPRLYAAADAFVLPSRGEGWGRPHVEAMAMGLPVIATNWSGPTAFLDDTCGYPLNFDGLVEVTEAGAFQGHKWAQPSQTHLMQLMRRAVSRPEEARQKGRMARNRMVDRYAPSVVAQLVMAQLHKIDQGLSEAALE
ncbi:hypothetical protein WJX73_010077 [Symbiochloris irregularis]|uniref:Glycosyltransferase n=1 Tax=Symbiochloris irregularis TaxID=706552 RepID=A0AAW1NT76_9CHLO